MLSDDTLVSSCQLAALIAELFCTYTSTCLLSNFLIVSNIHNTVILVAIDQWALISGC